MMPIHAVTFAPFARKNTFWNPAAYDSVEKLIERTGANLVMLVPVGLQQHSYSETIRWDMTVSDEELTRMIEHIHSLGVRVALKPTVNCMDGTWRAHIAFFDHDVVCEPKWSNWFKSYTEFQVHYAKLAKATGCELFVAGCEMVMSEHRDAEWRQVIAAIREVYDGPVSYNTDKYGEDHVSWWDAVDIISSSGYYPIHCWEKELDRIEGVVRKFDKPFFFAECGCMSVKDSFLVPNDWGVKGPASPEEQAEWYEDMFRAIEKRAWVGGTCLWSWKADLYPEEKALQDGDYEIYAKPAEKVVKAYYTKG